MKIRKAIIPAVGLGTLF
ncbi:Protein of unknown function [Lactobacillus helveticus CIRM-BIA 103]|nr:Protein of unknown function [Lactobacillus helveticus CIRM-BIA 103]